MQTKAGEGMRDIGKNIRELRTRKNMTQDMLAERLYVTRQTVSNYEIGRSRPDIEMLIKMAEVFETDVNSILYGLPDEQCRRKGRNRFFLGIFGCLLSGLPLLLFWNLAQESIRHGIAGPRMFLEFILLPLFLLFLGWTLMQGLSLLTKAKVPELRWSRELRMVLLFFVVLYFASMLPQIMHGIKSLLVHAYVKGLDSPMALRSSFSLRPDWLNQISGRMWLIFLKRQWLFFAAGFLFWLFGDSGKYRLRGFAFSALLTLGIAFLLYLCADSSFILEVADPQEFGRVPYSIQVEQYTGND